MDELEKKKEELEELRGESKDSNQGVQSEAVSDLDRADQIVKRQKEESNRREEILEREEALEARKRVGGVAEAGKVEEKPAEETPGEYSKRIMAGEHDG